MTGRWVPAFLVALALPPSLAAQAAACSPGQAASSAGADSLVALGRFWHAERAAPPLPRPPRAVPAGLGLLHARIRAGLGRWSGVDSVLRRVRGADTLPDAVALAAAAAEHREDWEAAERGYRRLAAMASASEAQRSRALVRRAVAFEMLARADSSAAAWRRAAQARPEIADWFALHRAGLAGDTALAFASVADPRSPGSALRADLLVAQRREAAGNLAGARAVYERLRRPVDVARVEFALGDRRRARQRADSVLFADPTRPQALLAANLLAAQRDTLSVLELAATARVYRALRDLRAAARAYGLALTRADTSASLWVEYAGLLADRRDRRGALAAADSAERRARRHEAAPDLLARAGVARVDAHAGVRQWDLADSLLVRLVARFPGDTAVARAMLALAEHDRAMVDTAAELGRYRLLLDRFTATPAANTARFRMAMYRYGGGQRDAAAATVRDVLARDSGNALGTAPRYWDARLRLERGDSLGRAALRRIAAREPFTFYGVRARNLLDDSLGFLPDTALAAPRPGTFLPQRAAERIRLLALVGFEQEARDEALGWAADTTASVQLLEAAAAAAAESGFAREAIRLGEAATARGGVTRGAVRGVMPLPYRGVIEGEAAERCLDPLLLAAIIRQETRFTPGAVSRVGARGIAQVMPATGRQLAQGLGIGRWDPALLFVPDFNLHLGARFVAQRLQTDGMPVFAAIAAYDAGAQRVDRWRLWPEFRDLDLFVERVAIPETRNYVKTVYASYQWYRRAYAAPVAPAPPAADSAGPPSS